MNALLTAPESELLDLVRHGHDLMARERACLTRGAFNEAASMSGEKSDLLDALEALIERVRGTDEMRRALTGLIADGRRNERLVLAAKQGVSSARRRVVAILATVRGAVAYDRDGTAITSRDDAIQNSSRA